MKIKRRSKALRILSKEKLRVAKEEKEIPVEEIKGPAKFTALKLLKLLEEIECQNTTKESSEI